MELKLFFLFLLITQIKGLEDCQNECYISQEFSVRLAAEKYITLRSNYSESLQNQGGIPLFVHLKQIQDILEEVNFSLFEAQKFYECVDSKCLSSLPRYDLKQMIGVCYIEVSQLMSFIIQLTVDKCIRECSQFSLNPMKTSCWLCVQVVYEDDKVLQEFFQQFQDCVTKKNVPVNIQEIHDIFQKMIISVVL